jgi:hypothetical protein
VKTGSNIAYVTLALYDWGDPPHCGDQGPPGNEAEVIPFTLHAKVAGLTGDHRHGVQAQGCSKGAAFLLGRRDGRVKLGDPPRTFLVGEDGGEPHVKIEALTLTVACISSGHATQATSPRPEMSRSARSTARDSDWEKSRSA